MDNKFFMVYVEGESAPIFKYPNREDAEFAAQRLANKFSKEAFVLEAYSVVTPNEINVKVDSYKAALEYLGRDDGAWMGGVADKHAKAISAMHKLITIAEAWNKADEFVPDFLNRNQEKWFPWFEYNRDAASFVYSTTLHTSTSAVIGSRLCFKSEEPATQFGKQFIDLWNDFLLFR